MNGKRERTRTVIENGDYVINEMKANYKPGVWCGVPFAAQTIARVTSNEENFHLFSLKISSGCIMQRNRNEIAVCD